MVIAADDFLVSFNVFIHKAINCIPTRYVRHLENENLILILFIAATGLWIMPPLNLAAGAGLDPSWKIGTIWSYLNHMQFGMDVIFPHGPLDFLEEPVMVNYPLWVLSVLFSLLKYSVFLVCLYRLFRQLSVKWYVYMAMIPALGYANIMYDSLPLITFSIFCLTIFLKDRVETKDVALAAIIALLLAVTSLIKFNVLVTCLAMLPLTFCIFAAYRNKIKTIALVTASYLMMLVALWLLAGQSISAIGDYIKTGVELSTGYNAAMLVPMSDAGMLVMLFTIVSLLGLLVYAIIRDEKRLFIFILLNAVIIVADYKHGIIRQEYMFQTTCLLLFSIFLLLILDGLRIKEVAILGFASFFIVAFCQLAPIAFDPLTIIAFLAILFTLLAAILVGTMKVKGIGGLRYVCIVLCIVTMTLLVLSIGNGGRKVSYDIPAKLSSWGQTLEYMADPGHFDGTVEAQKQAIRDVYKLDINVSNTIGNSSVDIVPWDIALCWAYDMNWTPRPVFQSYSVYTKYLDDLNSQYYNGKTAPQFVLYAEGSIDGRYPPFDEPATFRDILLNYGYVMRSGSFVLLNHTSDKSCWTAIKLGTVNAEMGKNITVPQFDGYVFGYVNCDYSHAGRIKSLIFKPSPLYIRFILNDSSITNYYRFIPDPAKNGILLSAYAMNINSMDPILKGNRTNNVAAITIDTSFPLEYTDLEVTFVGIPYGPVNR
jgi:hypothetical protein